MTPHHLRRSIRHSLNTSARILPSDIAGRPRARVPIILCQGADVMRKPITTTVHGVLDYLTVATFLTLPRALGCSERLTNAVSAVALGKLCYSLLTRHELGVVKAIPMQAHLAMDCVGGATLAALPFLLDEDNDAATAAFVALGIFDIAAAPLTQTTPSFDRRTTPVGRSGERYGELESALES